MFQKIRVETVLGLILIVAMGLLATKGIEEAAAAMAATTVSRGAVTETEGQMQTEGKSKETADNTVVIDAGHGGRDPGKEGLNGAIEKDINLSIAKKLQNYLEQEGVKVVMIREDENGLYDESASNKKQDDMRKRCAIIEETDPDLTVSIHQNSYHSESVSGPQVFYYSKSQEGAKIAGVIQSVLNEQLQAESSRSEKGNETYYLLMKTTSPTVIVECGFLSNNAEAAKLTTQEYQEQVAKAICDGILKCLKE